MSIARLMASQGGGISLVMSVVGEYRRLDALKHLQFLYIGRLYGDPSRCQLKDGLTEIKNRSRYNNYNRVKLSLMASMSPS